MKRWFESTFVVGMMTAIFFAYGCSDLNVPRGTQLPTVGQVASSLTLQVIPDPSAGLSAGAVNVLAVLKDQAGNPLSGNVNVFFGAIISVSETDCTTCPKKDPTANFGSASGAVTQGVAQSTLTLTAGTCAGSVQISATEPSTGLTALTTFPVLPGPCPAVP